MIVFVAPRNVPVKGMAVVGNLDASSGLPQSREITWPECRGTIDGCACPAMLVDKQLLSRQWFGGMECGGHLVGRGRDVHLLS